MRPEPGGVPVPGLGLAAQDVARALAHGWSQARPADVLTMLPLGDGAAGSARAIAAERIVAREHLRAPGPLDQNREAALVRLSNPRGAAAGSTWWLDTAAWAPLPEQADAAAQEALHGTSGGLGVLVAQALARTGPADTLVVGLDRSAVHDGGLGMIEAWGGVEGARRAVAGRDVVLALADGVALGGLAGSGQALASLAHLAPHQAQDLDRRACATAMRLAGQAALASAGEEGPVTGPPLLGPGAGGGHRPGLSATTWGTGAAGGCALVLRALGARALPGAQVMGRLVGLERAVEGQELVVTATGEAYDVPDHGVPAIAGRAAATHALPAVLVAGLAAVPRSELAAVGLLGAYSLQSPGPGGDGWLSAGPAALEARLAQLGSRLARTWSR